MLFLFQTALAHQVGDALVLSDYVRWRQEHPLVERIRFRSDEYDEEAPDELPSRSVQAYLTADAGVTAITLIGAGSLLRLVSPIGGEVLGLWALVFSFVQYGASHHAGADFRQSAARTLVVSIARRTEEGTVYGLSGTW